VRALKVEEAWAKTADVAMLFSFLFLLFFFCCCFCLWVDGGVVVGVRFLYVADSGVASLGGKVRDRVVVSNACGNDAHPNGKVGGLLFGVLLLLVLLLRCQRGR